MHRVIKKLLRRYGTAMVLVHDGQEQEVRAFLQETRSRSQSQVEKGISPLGEIPRGTFLYIGPVSPKAEVGDVIVHQQRGFEVRRGETVMAADAEAYCWGLCVEKGGDACWGS